MARGLKLSYNHGSNYLSGDFQDEIKCLGIEASPSFVLEPEGNGVAERFIRTLKENLLWVRAFKTIEKLRAELVALARRHNETWLGGMDSKRPRGVESSKPCHKLQLTRRSQPPYPWPPEQAQPAVSNRSALQLFADGGPKGHSCAHGAPRGMVRRRLAGKRGWDAPCLNRNRKRAFGWHRRPQGASRCSRDYRRPSVRARQFAA